MHSAQLDEPPAAECQQAKDDWRAMLQARTKELKPGGRMVYCTCSLLPEEGEEQLANVLERHPELQVSKSLPTGLEASFAAPAGGLRLRPDMWAERGKGVGELLIKCFGDIGWAGR